MTNADQFEPPESSFDTDPLRWKGDYPITKNKTVSISLLVVSTISTGLVAMFVIGLAVHDGNYEFAGRLLLIFGAIWLGFTLALFLIGLVFFGGKVPMEVVINDRAIVQEIHSKRARFANWASILGGAAIGGARGATAAGAGLLAKSRQVEGFEFRDLREAKGNPETGEIRLWDDWHTVMQVFAPRECYDAAMQRLQSGIERASARRIPRTDIPGAVKALVSVGALVFGGFLMAGFPLEFSFLFVIPMVIMTIFTIVSVPAIRPMVGWALSALIVASVVVIFMAKPPNLSESGAGLVTALQLGVLGLFVLFGVCAGLGVFNLQTQPRAKS